MFQEFIGLKPLEKCILEENTLSLSIFSFYKQLLKLSNKQ